MWVTILVKKGKLGTAHLLAAANKTNVRHDAIGSKERHELQYDVLLLLSLI
jgi:hypothetical protein